MSSLKITETTITEAQMMASKVADPKITGSIHDSDVRMTPMMAQYVEIKTANPDSLLFYRMGDFYELFFEDAEVASRALGITLTKRGKHLGSDIPMCGVPVHAADDYLQRLIILGHRVAVCEQMEDPAEAKKRGAKSVVQRDVVRLVTPGTLTEDTLLDASQNNYLAALTRNRGSSTHDEHDYALAWIDISTGEFRVASSTYNRLSSDLGRIDPSELLIGDHLDDDSSLRALFNQRAAITSLPRAYFDGATAESRITAFYGLATLSAYGSFTRSELSAAAAIIAYVERTQIGERPPIAPPIREDAGDVMQIDGATRANLEMTRTLSGERKGSLLHAIDCTVTSAGSRLLANRISAPLHRQDRVIERHDHVAFLLGETALRLILREHLAICPDIARALSRLLLNRGGPRDLGAIRSCLKAAYDVQKALMDGAYGEDLPTELLTIQAALGAPPEALADKLVTALDDELPIFRRDGGFVRPGFSSDLDDVRQLKDESRKVIAALQQTYQEKTNIRALKVKHNNVLGYFIEVPVAHGEKLMGDVHDNLFIHRQTLANAVRFTTGELANLESRIAAAGERALALEQAIFDELLEMVRMASEPMHDMAAALAGLDVAASFAELAANESYCRPKIDMSLSFKIENGRHPVVEQALKGVGGDPFVANDCDLSERKGERGGQIWLLTGPNMAGKSTFLRQNAVIAILAQAGGFVPAKSAHIGLVDRLFSRVGAADDLARGRSTFMVEMVETAAILNRSGERSLVILDEIGRGTSTFDGLSIAWASIEHLHEVNRSRALFATHYHELTTLQQKLERLLNTTVKVKEWQGDVIFLHEITPGVADRSYGIQVARLAGLPSDVITRAREVLALLEEQDRKAPREVMIDDLPLFMASAHHQPLKASASEEMGGDPLLTQLTDDIKALDLDNMTPRQAMDALYALKMACLENASKKGGG